MMLVIGLFALFLYNSRVVGAIEKETGNIFTSTHKLMHLMDAEVKSVEVMRNYIIYQRQMIDDLKRAQEKMAEGTEDAELYYQGVDHPINAYKLVNRYVAHWKKVYVMIFNNTNQLIYRDQIFSQLSTWMPHTSDFHGSYKSLLRLQFTYKINARHLSHGLINEKISDPLDQTDCYNMALTAIQSDLCTEALQWTRLAGEKAETEHKQWEILGDVNDLEQRVKSQGEKKMKDIILKYLMEAVGYETEGVDENENETEEEVIYDPGHEYPEQLVHPTQYQDTVGDVLLEDDNDLDVSEVASENYVPGELNIAQYTSEMEQELEEMDNYKLMKQMQDAQMEMASEDGMDFEEVSVEDAEDEEPLQRAMEQAQEDLEQVMDEHGSQTAQQQCGGVQQQVIKERTTEFSPIGISGMGGRVLKIKYQGNDIDDSELDKIQEMAEKAVEDQENANYRMDQSYQYNSLCRGEEVRKRELSVLACRYRYTNLPYNVWREELLSKDPLISMVYDFITDGEIDHMKELSHHHLTRAMAGEKFIEQRVQSSSWHDDDNSTIIYNLSQRASIATGLDCLNWAETWQVGQYGIAGHYGAHYDFNINRFKDSIVRGKQMGDRIATFMVYLNDVEAGGYTVFPQLGIHIRPVKKAAVFWYNYSLDGQSDERMLHAACPVLMGHKWVANKWIRMNGNEFHRPCGRTKAVTDYNVQWQY